MKNRLYSSAAASSQRGVALVAVLLFIVLIVGLTLAFLSRSRTAYQISASTLNGTKVSLLAETAGDTIIGDLKQEIVDGSTKSNPVSGQANISVYTPGIPSNTTARNFTAKPAIAGFTPVYNAAGIETDGLTNLIKRSAAGVPFYATSGQAVYAQSGPIRAINAHSDTASLDGRKVTIDYWNSHYLLARASPGAAASVTTPVSGQTGFQAPDWVLLSRDGSNPTTWSSSLANATTSNPSFVVGRYAYAIYDEGGLLDMNVAGYPTGLTVAQASRKSAAALADLTQLPLSATTATPVLTQAQINNLVGWRNYQSAGLNSTTGAFGGVNFTASTAGNWLTNFVVNNTTGFMSAISNNGTPPTDQAVLSRQELISLTQAMGIGMDALQYLGTFSRALEQPSYAPDPSRPKVINTGTPPPIAVNVDSYAGNNDSAGAPGGDDTFNPPFLSIRVAQGANWKRFNGATAVSGEPLVKTKFPLSLLGMVAWNASNGSLPTGFSSTTADPDPILDHFGLTRAGNSGPWVYNHGITSSDGSGRVIIGTLAQVAAQNREPDFAELLKAAITVGSIGKGGANLPVSGTGVGADNFVQYTYDVAIDYQVLQIMANLIDQQDTDSYPTWLRMSLGGTYRDVFGVEDIPYFYRYHFMAVVNTAPGTVLTQSDSVTLTPPTTTPPTVMTGSTSSAAQLPGLTPTSDSWTIASGASQNYCRKSAASPSGEATFMWVAELWNPHSVNNLSTSSTQRPTQFQITASTQDPAGIQTPWKVGLILGLQGSVVPSTHGTISDYPSQLPTDTPSALVPATDTITFNDLTGTLFREPSLIWNNIVAGNIVAATVGNSAKDINTLKTYYGFVAGKIPIQTTFNVVSTPSNPAVDGAYLVQGNTINLQSILPTGSSPQISFVLSCQDGNGNPIPYDTKYPDFHGLVGPNIVASPTDPPYINNYWNPLASSQVNESAGSIDPRSPRWGVAMQGHLGNNEAGQPGTAYSLDSNGRNTPSSGTSDFSVIETDRPRPDVGDYYDYSNPATTANPLNLIERWFGGTGYSNNGSTNAPHGYSGMFSQNVPGLIVGDHNSNFDANIYYEDPDGMVRRAVGAYAYGTTGAAGGSTNLQTPAGSVPTNAAVNSQAQINGTGLPEVTSGAVKNTGGIIATFQSQSRPLILNRAFRSVSDMSYAFRGTPWKNIDFFTPESGDSALLDVFCVNAPPANGLVAGKVDLNTRQEPVLQSIVSGAYRDELAIPSATNPGFTMPATSAAVPPLTAAEAKSVATKLIEITEDTTHAWRGPLSSVADLVGRYYNGIPSAPGGDQVGMDWITYVPLTPASGETASMTYAGLSAVLTAANIYGAETAQNAAASSQIQRMREGASRPLMDCGQTRVWNLLIDIVAQTGRYPITATSADQFAVEGQRHVWLHVAIDRYTGQVLDEQEEFVTK